MKKNNFSLIFICYNKYFFLQKLIKKSIIFLKKNKNLEIIFIDNGSNDETLKIFLIYKKKKFKNLKFYHIKKNIGYGHGILYGLNKCKNNIIGWTHADDVEIFKKLKYILKLKLFNYKNIFIKGFRESGRSLNERFFSFGLTIVASLLLMKKFSEITAQPTFFSKGLKLNFDNPPLDFSLDLYIFFLARKMNYKFFRVKYKELKTKKNYSSWNTGLISRIKLSIIYIKYIVNLARN